jgi:hypothetical protein
MTTGRLHTDRPIRLPLCEFNTNQI